MNVTNYIVFLQNNLVMSKKAVPLQRISIRNDVSRSRAVVARQAHNLKVGGSIPPSATKEKPPKKRLFV